jgi:hypothetical protein
MQEARSKMQDARDNRVGWVEPRAPPRYGATSVMVCFLNAELTQGRKHAEVLWFSWRLCGFAALH